MSTPSTPAPRPTTPPQSTHPTHPHHTHTHTLPATKPLPCSTWCSKRRSECASWRVREVRAVPRASCLLRPAGVGGAPPAASRLVACQRLVERAPPFAAGEVRRLEGGIVEYVQQLSGKKRASIGGGGTANAAGKGGGGGAAAAAGKGGGGKAADAAAREKDKAAAEKAARAARAARAQLGLRR